MILEHFFTRTLFESVSLRDMVNVVDEHYPKYYAELSGSDISDRQFEKAIVNAYKKIMQKQGAAEAIRPDVMRHQGDKTIKIVKRAGKPMGEIGIDAEASSGIGSYYVKMYDGSYDAVGFHTAEEALAELKDIIKQTMAEGAPELLKKEMPLHRHAEKLLAQNGVSKDDPDYHYHLGNTIKHLRQFGNIDLINKQGVAEGLDDTASATPAKNERGRFTAWDDDEPIRLKCEDGEFRTIQEINMLRQKIGMKPFSIKSQQGVAEARMSAAQRLWNAEQKQRAKSDASLRRTPSSIPKKQEPVDQDKQVATKVDESRRARQSLMARIVNSR